MTENYHTLTNKLSEVVKKAPEKIVLQTKKTTGYEHYTYQDLYQNAQKVAKALVATGMQKKERVAIVLENRPEWVFIYFGILYAGLIAVPLDPQSTAEDLEYLFKDSESKIIFTSPSLLEKIYSATQTNKNSYKIILLDQENIDKTATTTCEFSKFLTGATQPLTNIEILPSDTASILYTSGTTDKPKGVVLTHQNFYANFNSIEKLWAFETGQNILAVLPLHHSLPFMVTLIIPIFLQGKVTYPPKLERNELLTCLQETNAAFFVGVPTFYNIFHHEIQNDLHKIPWPIRTLLWGLINIGYKLRQLTGYNLNKLLLAKIHDVFGKNLKYFISGGAKLDKSVELFFNKLGFTLIQGYGLTETSPIVTINPLTKQKIGSVGKVIPDVTIKIVDPDTSGVGEVAIRGPNVMSGYYHRDTATQAVLKDGWFYSGDLGYCDKQGYLFLTGRKKELIILASGKNISPEEVENHYLKGRYIKELCVLASGNDKKEKLTAVIVPNFEYFKKTGEINVYETIKLEIEIFSKNYPLYKSIMGFIITKDDLPRTNLGKLKRHEIRKKYLSALTSAAPPLPQEELDLKDINLLDSPIYKAISHIINEEKQLSKPIHLNDHLGIDLDFDSLSRVELISALEKQFNIKITETSVAKIATIKEMIFAVEQAITEQKTSGEKIITSAPPKNLWQDILNNNPDEAITNKIGINPTWTAKIFTMSAYALIYTIIKPMWRPKIIGIENLPQNQPFILCPNHTSYLDGFLIFYALPSWLKIKTFSLGDSVFFDVPVIRHLIKLGRVIPLDLATNLLDAMRACSYVLRHNKVMCIFPEGGRSPDGSIQPFKKGVGILARELNIPLIPVYLDGAFKALPRGKSWPSCTQIKITFGKPYTPDELKEKGLHLGIKDSKDDYEAIAKGLELEVKNLTSSSL